jgi:hypothetical protein
MNTPEIELIINKAADNFSVTAPEPTEAEWTESDAAWDKLFKEKPQVLDKIRERALKNIKNKTTAYLSIL